jgi:magnesium transporter
MPLKGTRSITLGKLTWIDVQNPQPGLLEKLRVKHGFHELDMEDVLSDNQRSKIDDYKEYLFILLHIPYYDKRKQQVLSEEVDIFIKNNLLITIHWGSLKPLVKFYDDCKKKPSTRKEMMDHGSGFLLYEVIDQLYSSAFPMLDSIERSVTSLERDVFSWGSSQKDRLKDILNLKKNIINFRRIVGPQRPVIAQIEHKNKKFLPESLEIYFDDVVDKIEKIWSSLENLKELVTSIQETNESIISHRTNNVIQVLTIFSVVIAPLTFLTGLYGMNVGLPFASEPWIFLVLIGCMFLIILGMLGFFKHKNWL